MSNPPGPTCVQERFKSCFYTTRCGVRRSKMVENVFFTLTVPMTVATATPPRPTNADPEDIESILYFFGIIDNQKQCVFLAALAALYLTLVTQWVGDWVTATLEF